jgi:sec-independent protein translocase protein TatC
MVNKPEEAALPAPVEESESGGPVKTFLEHLEDLRWMLIKSVVAILISMLVCLVAGNRLVTVLTWPLEQASKKKPPVGQIPVMLGTNVLGRLPLNALNLATNQAGSAPPASLSLTPIQVGTNVLLGAQLDWTSRPQTERNSPVLKKYTIYGGLILASPFVIYFVGSFVLPALKLREKKLLYQVVAFGSALFFIGVAFCYFVVASVAIMATVEFSKWMGFAADEWRAEDYITFMCRFMVGMGVAFELPVFILTIVKIGLLDYGSLVRFRAYAIVGNLVLAAFITPSADPITMFLMAIPLQLLYEISVIIAWYWEWRDRRCAAAKGAS